MNTYQYHYDCEFDQKVLLKKIERYIGEGHINIIYHYFDLVCPNCEDYIDDITEDTEEPREVNIGMSKCCNIVDPYVSKISEIEYKCRSEIDEFDICNDLKKYIRSFL